MAVAVSTTEEEIAAARHGLGDVTSWTLAAPWAPPDPARWRDGLEAAAAGVDAALAELRADPARRDAMAADARAEFICDAARAAVRRWRAARANAPEDVP